jgi:peptide/nickel transport system ATP-binding protein
MIEVVDLHKTYAGRGGLLNSESVHALRGVSLSLPDAATLALLGESGCGKTTLGRILAGLETYDGGDIIIDGVSVNSLSGRRRTAAFQKIQLIHQDPYAALNPVRTIGQSLEAPLGLQASRAGESKRWIAGRARELLQLVGLDPEEVLYKYPHNLSGGQRQRVVIARALTVEPKVLIADEAVSMIDVSLRLGILRVLNDLRERLGIATVFITHDVAAARFVANAGNTCVIYRGEIFEYGRTESLIAQPVNPYTQSLLSAVPVLVGLEEPGPDRFIPMDAIESDTATEGCLFHGRCPFATETCRQRHPELLPIEELQRLNRCHYPAVRHVVAVPVQGPGEPVPS